MTLRAVLLGLLAAILVAAVGYLNDGLLQSAPMVENYFPTSVFGALFILVLAINPLLFHIRRKWRFSGAELAVMLAITLAACNVPGQSLMRSFTTVQAMPAYHERNEVGWQRTAAVDYMPDSLLISGGEYDPVATEQFVVGMGSTENPISLGEVPWYAWVESLSVWTPLVLLFAIASVCTAMLVHRQWTRNERLRYPIVEFTNAIVSQESGKGLSGVFRQYLFWLALGIVLFVHLVNGLTTWDVQSVRIPLTYDFGALIKLFPSTGDIWQSYYMYRPTIYPMILGFAFFLSSEISLSLGIANIVFVFAMAAAFQAGMPADAGQMSGFPAVYTRFGAYAAAGALLIYTGRRFYGQVFKQALLPLVRWRSGQEIPRYAVWACRMLIVSLAGLVGVLMGIGLDWPIAILLVLLFMLMYVVLGRIVAETGMPYVGSQWIPAEVILALFGGYALGPVAIAIVCMLSMAFTLRAREIAIPFLVNGLKIWDDNGVRPGRFGKWAVASYVLAFAVAVPVVLWTNYNYGAFKDDKWSFTQVPVGPFNVVSKEVSKLTADDELQSSESLTPLQRLTNIEPNRIFLYMTGVGVVGVLALSFLRLRYTWWPFHPILILMAGTIPAAHFSASLLLGWLLKGAITRFGGTAAYRKAKIFMMGVIAGDLLGGALWMIVGAIYYAVTGVTPEKYSILP